ncbi:hypothetical protein E4T63_15990 [Pseudomonas fluorescens]|uniref:Uncharacterized protein n=1 Tax=Pseudomonas fluorescens TaxID=294 RepID=A0AAP8YZG7_PSEFL|nr:hypothetical protein E4T63_15990 [Pseudomonas fluorescens]
MSVRLMVYHNTDRASPPRKICRIHPANGGVFIRQPQSHKHHCTLWEGACSRKRWISRHLWYLTHRLREQAPSHSGNHHRQEAHPVNKR